MHFHSHGRGLRHIILHLLASEGPLTGAEIMEKVEEESMGMWRPSPGSVYPMIKVLEDEGLIKVAKIEGTKKFYELSDKGRELIGAEPKEKRISQTITELDSLVDYVLDNWDKLSKEDKETLKKILEKLNNAFE
ncbi:PadR family transcriptional regulator [Acidianus manzaensis]|uniref:PadR family transcriptional regulator n=1 Tax=Acidianus manzaensis TaxID=282676 RepID=A0A1W6K2D8_9CREN|nr:PadR family transcriptional regulator [Acidianus manzaensis]ARM76665.1 PadR family transcriptional regulator [Acidianus manzaensis]